VSERAIREVALFTDDVEGVASFYRDLTGSPPESEWPGGAIFVVGGVTLLVHERGEPERSGPANEDHVAVGVPDVDAAFAELRARGHAVDVEPRDYEWGRSAYLRDPDGRLVELAQT
jgi:catechol 2,3-dioxygenase-like lactoylglutathione lyase family enzyme